MIPPAKVTRLTPHVTPLIVTPPVSYNFLQNITRIQLSLLPLFYPQAKADSDDPSAQKTKSFHGNDNTELWPHRSGVAFDFEVCRGF